MDTNIKHLIGGGVLALLLTACGGGSGGGGDVSGNSPTPSTRDLPEEIAARRIPPTWSLSSVPPRLPRSIWKGRSTRRRSRKASMIRPLS